jgi:hypothetical protein
MQPALGLRSGNSNGCQGCSFRTHAAVGRNKRTSLAKWPSDKSLLPCSLPSKNKHRLKLPYLLRRLFEINSYTLLELGKGRL